MGVKQGLSVLALVLLASLAGCVAAPSVAPSVSAESPSPDEAEAIRFRTSFGLRSDPGWVRSVAADPAASVREFGVPLMPAEIAELNARAANREAILGVIRAYVDEHRDESGGLYIDQEQGGAVTTLWTANLEWHAAAIRALVRPGSRIAFRSAAFTEEELGVLHDRVSADLDWMHVIGIAPLGVSDDVVGNQVEVLVSSADPDAPSIVAAHYGAPPGMLIVISDGTGAALLGRGTVRGLVLDPAGAPPGQRLADELILQWTSDGPGDCGSGDMGFGLLPDGSFELPCQAGGHTIMVQIGIPNDGWQTIASGHVIAAADAVVSLEIRLDGEWPAPTTP